MTQTDIKRVLAYSTVSQLGIMFMGVGMGVFWAAELHLVTHAFFKACLFLGAGSVMHGMNDQIDMRRFGGIATVMKITWVTFGLGWLAQDWLERAPDNVRDDSVSRGVGMN